MFVILKHLREPQAQMSGSIKVNFCKSTEAFEFIWATNLQIKVLEKAKEFGYVCF